MVALGCPAGAAGRWHPGPVTSGSDRDSLRRTFDGVAGSYHRARPDYPAELFDDLLEVTGLAAGSRLLEVGCATGKATLPLARRGFRITCVELGADLAAAGRANLAGFDAEAYLDLLSTFSGHIAMTDRQRDRLYGEIRRRLGDRPDGMLRRHWGAALHITRAEVGTVTAPGLRRSGGSPAASAPRGPAPGPRGPRPRPRTGGFRSRTARVTARS